MLSYKSQSTPQQRRNDSVNSLYTQFILQYLHLKNHLCTTQYQEESTAAVQMMVEDSQKVMG